MFRFSINILISFVFLLFHTSLFAQELVIYSGRSKSLVDPIIQQFEKETGIRVRVRYGDTSQLAVALLEEGRRSPADIFWAQDAGALGVLAREGMFRTLPETVLELVPRKFRSSQATWVATSGRARVLAYSPRRVRTEEIPRTIYELTDPQWAGRIGISPQNASFQTFVSVMINTDGIDRTREWLISLRRNGVKTYRSNVPIIQAIAAGEIDLGLTNHYYLVRFKKNDPDFPVEQTFLQKGDISNFVNIAGAGILSTSPHYDHAVAFILFLLSAKGQQYFTSEVYEYPVSGDVIPNPSLLPLDDVLDLMPPVSLDILDTLDETLKLLRDVGLL